jgi:Tfp pilus assembly protein PilV
MNVPRGEQHRGAESSGFNVLELMLGLTLITIAALTLVALSFTSIASRQKAENLTDAMLVAEEQLDRAVLRIETLPESQHETVWNAGGNGSFSEGSVNIGGTDYGYEIEAREVSTGTSGPNRLLKLDATVWWWGEQPGESRIGSGRLEYGATRLVREVVNSEPD